MYHHLKTQKINLFLLIAAFFWACSSPQKNVGFQARATSENQHVTGLLSTNEKPLVLNEYLSFALKINPLDNTVPSDFTLTVEGGMPAHNHGFPSAIKTSRLDSQTFLIEGVKFHMPGQWQLQVHIDEDFDILTFNLEVP